MGAYIRDITLKQEGGPVEGGFAEASPEMASLGMVNEPGAMPPQEGGVESVADDIPQEANDGDYVLPYETVLLYGLNQLNRYAKEAIELAKKNNVDLSGADINPEDDVPIKISNYEYVIPKGLVPFFGGGQKYLDKIRKEGMDFRAQLEKEGQGDAASQQEAAAPVGAAPPSEGFVDEAPLPPPPMEGEMMPPGPPMEGEMMPPPPMEGGMPPPGPPPAPMMVQKGGFVLSKDKEADILEKDAPQSAEKKRVMAQQPPMVTPEGKRVQQGFSAPSGYAHGGEIHEGLGFEAKDVKPANVGQMRQNAEDALNILKGYEKSFASKQRTDEKLA